MPAKIRMRKFLEASDAKYLKENVPGIDIAAAFMQRINFGATQPDAITYGNERVERLIIRGTQPEYAAALPLFTVATVNLKVSTSYQKNTQTGTKVDRTYSMAVHIRAIQDEMPAGMEKILGILEDAIKAQPAKAPSAIEAPV